MHSEALGAEGHIWLIVGVLDSVFLATFHALSIFGRGVALQPVFSEALSTKAGYHANNKI